MFSCTELLNEDRKQILDVVTNMLIDEQIPTGACNVDINGDPIVDANGVCTDPVMENVPVSPAMSTDGARASARFFSRFNVGGAHNGYLNNSELKLLSEWLDLRANYYNNPFDSVEP